MFLWPGPSRGPATAPAQILVGALMIEGVRHVEWGDIAEAVPAFLTMILMPLTFSIANGVSFGVISYCLIALLSGRGRKVSPIMYVVTALLLARDIFLGGG
jgi:AGZA family xanthine/uracil permease-like MFS transporter